MSHFLIETSRKAIEEYVRNGKRLAIPKCDEAYRKKRGVFVTIYKKSPKRLRGCIGFPYPSLPLIDALIEASISACNDPRFPPLSERELDDIEIELSVLTDPELIRIRFSNPREYLKEIKIGKDGLIIKNGPYSGLLLPQVASENGWKVEEFLENLCLKAGMTVDAWMDKKSKIFKFQAEIIGEKPGF